jgi:putative endonuclease
VGRRAETLAQEELRARGYAIVEANWRGSSGELDIVARDGDYLVFVEVRCRRGEDFGDPVESIDPAKRAAVLRTARAYVQAHDAEDVPVRFDVVTVSGEALDRVTLYADAFGVDDPWR